MSGIESNYAINVAKAHPTRKAWASEEPAYEHFVKLELGSRWETDAIEMLADTRARYPYPDFKVHMTHWSCSGTTVGGDY